MDFSTSKFASCRLSLRNSALDISLVSLIIYAFSFVFWYGSYDLLFVTVVKHDNSRWKRRAILHFAVFESYAPLHESDLFCMFEYILMPIFRVSPRRDQHDNHRFVLLTFFVGLFTQFPISFPYGGFTNTRRPPQSCFNPSSSKV